MHRRMSDTLPRSWRETKLLTKLKVDEDPDKISERKRMTENLTPAQLAQMTSVADLPVPRPLEAFWKSDAKKKKDTVDDSRLELQN